MMRPALLALQSTNWFVVRFGSRKINRRNDRERSPNKVRTTTIDTQSMTKVIMRSMKVTFSKWGRR